MSEPIVGNPDQEERIAHLAEKVYEAFPDMGPYSYKGALRVAIRSAQEGAGSIKWKELFQHPLPKRTRFFKEVLSAFARELEREGFNASRIKEIQDLLWKQNMEFLKHEPSVEEPDPD